MRLEHDYVLLLGDHHDFKNRAKFARSSEDWLDVRCEACELNLHRFLIHNAGGTVKAEGLDCNLAPASGHGASCW